MRIGNVGEALALSKCLEQGFEVYTGFGEHNAHDLIVYNKKDVLLTLQVKTSEYLRGQSYQVDLRYNRYRIGNAPYDSSISDILVIVLPLENAVIFFDNKKVFSKTMIAINIEKLKKGEYCLDLNSLC